MQQKNFAIINYGSGNYGSLAGIINKLGHIANVTNNKNLIKNSDFIILPGVGSFPKAIKSLKKYNLINFIKQISKSGKPILGICLGMQLLFTLSYELKKCKGLNLIKGKVIKFKRRTMKQNIIPKNIKSLRTLFNHIRMLDAHSYPSAFINYGNLRIEFTKAKINKKNLDANVNIKLISKKT